MGEIKLNNKELIKRAKELISLIEENELANSLTAKLRITEEQIKEKEDYEKELKAWKAYGFRKNEIQLKTLIDNYNRYHNKKIYLRIIANKEHIDTMVRVNIIFGLEGKGRLLQESYVVPNFDGNDWRVGNKERLEQNLGIILKEIFRRGVEFSIPRELIPSTDIADDPYFVNMTAFGMQVMQPNKVFNYEINDFRNPAYPKYMKAELDETYPSDAKS